jgi:hypothetical protein
MRLKCPKCEASVDAAGFEAGERIHCPECRTRLKLPTDPPDALMAPTNPFDFDSPSAKPVVAPQPMIVPIPYSTEHPELTNERIEDLRERREDRRERRQYDREDRVGNGVGLAGFALTVTAFLLVGSAALFGRELKAYGWFATFIALALTLAGLPCGIIGSLRPGRARLFAIIAAGLGGLLLLVFVPALMLMLSNSDK